MKTVKKMTTSGAFVLDDDAKIWGSISLAIKWIGFRADEEVSARKDLFCFSARIRYDEQKHKFSVFDFDGKAAIYLEWEDETGEHGKFLKEADMKDWDIIS